MHVDLKTAAGTIRAFTGGKPFDPALPTVVFLHGAGMDHTAWTLHARWFAHHGRGVLALDLPGHGASGSPAAATIGDYAEAVIQALDAAGAAKATLIGHSLGSLIALEVAVRQPGRVRSLGLVGAAAKIPVNPALIEAARANLPAAVTMIVGWSFGPHATVGASPSPGLSLTGLARQVLLRSRPGTLHADLTACAGYDAGLESGNRIWCPTVLVIGEHDRMTSAECGRKLAQAIPGATVAELSGIGHMLPLEAPDAVLEALATVA